MTAHFVTAYEHQSLRVASEPSDGAIEEAEAEALERIAGRLTRFAERGHQSVRLAHYCGVVSMGMRLLEIVPKVEHGTSAERARGLLFNLLRRSGALSAFRHQSAGQRLERAPLIEIFIAAFFDAVVEIVRGGLMRSYELQEEDLHVIRGRIDLSRQFTALANRQDVIACHYDDLTADNAWNQFIKVGVRASRKWIGSAHLQRRWAELMIAFDEVTDVEPSAEAFDKLVVERRTRRYVPAADWARRILTLVSPALRAGPDHAPGLLFDVNALWETAVAAEFRRRIQDGPASIETQVGGRYLASLSGGAVRAVGLRPDLVVFKGQTSTLVGDTKWKALELGRGAFLKPAQEDIYQMHAYAATFGCTNLALIYPWHSGLADSRETVLELPAVGATQPRIRVVCVDVAEGRFQVMRGAEILDCLGS